MLFYLNRPLLAGKNLRKVPAAVLRARFRRSDPDGTSAVPYFPGLTAGDTLTGIIKVNPASPTNTSFSVTFTGNSLETVLNDINAVLSGLFAGGAGVATESDGVVTITSTMPGGYGFILVNGGTGAAAIGFDTTAGAIALGGDLPRAPEGRVENSPFAVFPSRENLTSDVLLRSFNSLSANSDILQSDVYRKDARLKKQTATSSADGKYITLSGSIYTGAPGTLSGSSSKEDLAPYFAILDPSTKLPVTRAVGLVQGVPVGDPPYADTTAWKTLDGGNLLGTDLVKASATITNVIDGCIAECAGATFVTAGVTGGDYVSITGATNVDPWTHNGYRWVVVETRSEERLFLRPMSAAERVQFGSDGIIEIDPVLELNPNGSGYGTLSVRTGNHVNNTTVNLVVRPAVTPSSTFEVWYPETLSSHESSLETDIESQSPVFRTLVSDFDPEPNGILSRPSVTVAGAGMSVGSFYVRWHGRVQKVPATSFTAPGGSSVRSIYWEDATNSLKMVDSATSTSVYSGPANPIVNSSASTAGFQVALATVVGGNFTTVDFNGRMVNGSSGTITVGHGGQFQDLKEAADYLNQFPPRSFSTARPYFEVIVVGDVTITEGSSPSFPDGTIIRGASREVQVTFNATSNTGAAFLSNGNFTLENLTVKSVNGGGWGSLVKINAAGGKVVLRGLVGTTTFRNITTTVAVGTAADTISIENCSLVAGESVVATRSAHLEMRWSTFSFSSIGAATPTVIHDSSGSWLGTRITIDSCSFQSWVTTSSTRPLIVDVTSGFASVRNSTFGIGNHASANNSVLFVLSGAALTTGGFLLENVSMTSGKIPRVIVGNGGTEIRGCAFLVNPEGANTAVIASRVSDTSITHQDTDANVVGGTAFRPSNSNATMTECSVAGPFYMAVFVATAFESVEISDNLFDLQDGTNAKNLICIQMGSPDSITISGNTILSGVKSTSTSWTGIGGTAPTKFKIQKNSISFPEPTPATFTINAIQMGGSKGLISENSIFTTDPGTPDVNQSVYGLNLTGSDIRIIGNYIALNGSGVDYWYGISTIGNPMVVENNYVLSYGIVMYQTFTSDGIVSNNKFVAASSTAIPGGYSYNLSGSVTGNTFVASTPGSWAHNVTFGSGRFSNNVVAGKVFLGSSPGSFVFEGNQLQGDAGEAFDGLTTPPSFNEAVISNNVMAGSFKITTSSTANLVVNGNFVSGLVDLILGGGSLVASGNTSSSFSCDLSTASESSVSYSGNKTTSGNAGFTSTRAEVVGNDIAGSLTVNEGYTTSGTVGIVSENKIGSALTTYSKDIIVTGNKVGTSFDHIRTIGYGAALGSTMKVSRNTFGGSITANGLDGVNSCVWTCDFSDNLIRATTSNTALIADILQVKGNEFATSNSSEVLLRCSSCWVEDNYIFSDSPSVGTNSNTKLQVTAVATSVEFLLLRGNRIDGRISLPAVIQLYLVDNSVYYQGAFSAVTCGQIGGAFANYISVISGNMVTADPSTLTDTQNSAILVNSGGGASGRVLVSGNSINLLASARSGSPPSITKGAFQSDATTCKSIIFTGNHIMKPTDNAPRVWAYVLLGGVNTDVVVNGNLMYYDATIGTAGSGRRGENVYSAGGGAYSITQ